MRPWPYVGALNRWLYVLVVYELLDNPCMCGAAAEIEPRLALNIALAPASAPGIAQCEKPWPLVLLATMRVLGLMVPILPVTGLRKWFEIATVAWDKLGLLHGPWFPQ